MRGIAVPASKAAETGSAESSERRVKVARGMVSEVFMFFVLCQIVQKIDRAGLPFTAYRAIQKICK
jgi:hypothetical protein